MEIGKRIKAHRAVAGMSQDELARRVYVSRQTISSWENDKTYPDVQSLLMLSEIFDATVDELIKGDVNTMTETIDRDVAIFKRLGAVITVFLLLMVAVLVWLSVQMIVWDWTLAQTLPTIMLAFVLWGIAMAGSVWAEQIKKEHDLATYQEVLAFMSSKAVDRNTERGRRERLIPRWMKTIRTIGFILISMAVGAFLGWNLAALVDNLLS